MDAAQNLAPEKFIFNQETFHCEKKTIGNKWKKKFPFKFDYLKFLPYLRQKNIFIPLKYLGVSSKYTQFELRSNAIQIENIFGVFELILFNIHLDSDHKTRKS